MDAEWVAATAEKVLAAVEERRSTWQSWHVRAEAQRHVRAAEIATDKVDQLVELLVTEVLQTRSMSLTRPDDGISEPGVLCRADGSSVYTVAGSELFTSARILAAEQRLVATAGRTDGRVLDAGTVELALLESAANGNRLGCWAGRFGSCHVHLRGAAAAGDRPRRRRENHRHAHPGSGVDATAAARWSGWPRRPPQRRSSATPPAHRPKRWPSSPGPSTTMTCPIGRNASAGPALVIIDEAGMADTLSLDTAVQFIIGRGGSIRLIGDDQQLAAIGAGGVLRDIQASYGALRLTELHRFTDPAEAAATLAVRDGRPEALGFYLDRRRVHVGDPTTTLDAVFNGLAGRPQPWSRCDHAGSDPGAGQPAQPTRPEPPPRRHNPEPGDRVGRRQPGQRRRPDHHPGQRPQTAHHRNRLGEKR